MWYPLLFKDATFRSKVQERWAGIYPALANAIEHIDVLARQNRVSDTYNHAMWPTTRELKNNSSAAFNGDEDMTFDEATKTLKKAYENRLTWMNNQITSGNFVTNAE